jgi:hypothetical protein
VFAQEIVHGANEDFMFFAGAAWFRQGFLVFAGAASTDFYERQGVSIKTDQVDSPLSREGM